MPEYHWATESVEKLISKDIINGYPDGTFRPDNPITVEQFIKLTVSALGYINLPTYPGEYWANPYIRKAKVIGLFHDDNASSEDNLYLSTYFDDKYDKLITRQEVCFILNQAEKKIENGEINYEGSQEFIRQQIKDLTSVDPIFEQYVIDAYGLGLINGYSDNTFKPKNNLTRAQSAVVIVRLLYKHWRTIKEYDSIFKESDLDLKPEVQQMISYYDDINLQAQAAVNIDIITSAEYGYLMDEITQKIEILRTSNELIIEKDNSILVEAIYTIGGFIPFIGTFFDFLDNSLDVYAADFNSRSMGLIADNSNSIEQLLVVAAGRHAIYELIDDDGVVKYVGRTKQTLEKRLQQHWKDPMKNGLKIRHATFDGKVLKDLTYSQVRGLEQMVYEKHINSGKRLLNKIRPMHITTKNTLKKLKNQKYLDSALDFLKKIIS